MSIIIGLCIKKFEKKGEAWPEKNNFENVFGVDNQTVNEKNRKSY